MGQQRLLRITEVENIVSLGKTKIYGLISEGSFPRPLVIGTRATRWKYSDIQGWISNLGKVKP